MKKLRNLIDNIKFKWNDFKCCIGIHDYELVDEITDIRLWDFFRSESYYKESELTESQKQSKKVFKPAKVKICLRCGYIDNEYLHFKEMYEQQAKQLQEKEEKKQQRRIKAFKLYDLVKDSK